MSLDRAPTEDEAVTSIDALIEGFRTAERPRAEHGVGLEHEKFLYPLADPPTPVPYDGPRGIRLSALDAAYARSIRFEARLGRGRGGARQCHPLLTYPVQE